MVMHRLQPSQIDKPKAAKFPRLITEAEPRKDSLETNPFVDFTHAIQTRLVLSSACIPAERPDSQKKPTMRPSAETATMPQQIW